MSQHELMLLISFTQCDTDYFLVFPGLIILPNPHRNKAPHFAHGHRNYI